MNNPGAAITLLDNLAYAPSAIEIDSIGEKMYWMDTTNQRILRANLDGSGIESVVDGAASLQDLCLDMSRERIYWIDDLYIKKAHLNGSGAAVVLDDTGPGNYGRMVLDISGAKIYFTAGSAIYRTNLDGSGALDITDFDTQGDLTADFTRGKIYWFPDLALNGFMRVDLDGGNRTSFDIGELPSARFTMNAIDGKIYFSAYDPVNDKDVVKRWSEATGVNLFLSDEVDFGITGIAFEYE
jgi:hypothetical protein